MNLMFRKNFAEKGSTGSERSGFSGGPGLVSNLGPAIGSGSGRMRTGMINSGRGPIRRSREFGYYTMDHEHAPHSYRTHLFFSPHSGTSGLSSEDTIERINANSRRNSSAHNIKWGCNATAQTTSPGPSQNGKIKPIHQRELPPDFSSRKVSFNTAQTSGAHAPLVVSDKIPAQIEPISLATLDRDCFIIPLASLNRFLPAGIPQVSVADKKKPGGLLSVFEVEDPKQCILIHFMTLLEPLDPLMDPSLTESLTLQRDTAAGIVTEIAPSAVQSILMVNMEKNAEFPFITYYLINKQKVDPSDFYQDVQGAVLQKFEPKDLRFAASHTLDLFNEVATIARPPLEPPGGRLPIPTTGYIVIIFKVFEGDDGLKFEQNWLYWTGARMIYRYLPKCVGLRRITLHKSVSLGDKMYFLVCECSQLQENLSSVTTLLPALRARLCGYVGLYRPSLCF